MPVAQKTANDFLDSEFTRSIKEFRRVRFGGELRLCAIGDGHACIGRRPTFTWLWMLELDKEIVNVSWHADATASVNIVPFDVYS